MITLSVNFARRSARTSVALVAALALSGTLCATAHAEGPGTAGGADPGITVEVGEGPYLVGQTIPVEVTVTNHGTATATNVRASNQTVSGSHFSTNGYGPLSGFPGASIPAGQKLVVTVEARVYNWEGNPVTRFSISSNGDSSSLNNTVEAAIPMTAPDVGRGSVSGLVYGDANDNGAADAGEGLQGVRVALSGNGPNPPKTLTGADGGFRFDDLPLRTYGVFVHGAPDGWVVPSTAYVDVRGDEHSEHRGVRPLSDRFEASMAFVEDSYEVGQAVEMTLVLTNKGDSDISGVKAGCDRSGGEGPHLVDMALGDLGWAAAGVTVGAGRSRTFTITGVVPAKAAGFASVSVACDFGPGDDPVGYPEVRDRARVPGAGPGGTWGVLYEDRDFDTIADADELLPGVEVSAFDAISGLLAATTTTGPTGRLEFTDLPAGPYTVRLRGPWQFEHGHAEFTIGTCGTYCLSGWHYSVLSVPDTDPPAPSPTVPQAGAGSR